MSAHWEVIRHEHGWAIRLERPDGTGAYLRYPWYRFNDIEHAEEHAERLSRIERLPAMI